MPIFLALNGYYGQPVLSPYFKVIILHHENQCSVQKIKVVVVTA